MAACSDSGATAAGRVPLAGQDRRKSTIVDRSDWRFVLRQVDYISNILSDGAGHCLIEATTMKATLFFAAALIMAMLDQSTASADQLDSTWVSIPRGLVTIILEKDSGRMAGPGWEHRFKGTTSNLNFEIAPGRRFTLRRSGNAWVGEYFHPRIGTGTRESEVHKMTFVCDSGGCSSRR